MNNTNKNLKESYFDGKNKIAWHKTTANKKEFINKLKTNNQRILLKKDRVRRKVIMIDGDTLNPVKTFDSRFKAAEYISSINGRNVQSIYGNMTMRMSVGGKSYGHYWKIVEED